MRLTFKDVIGTLLAGAAVLVTVAITNGWGWPLLSDYRSGTVALALIGFGMCAGASDYSSVRGPDPFNVVASVLGVAALGLIVAGLIWANGTVFVWLAAVIVALWAVSTVRHLIVPTRALPARPLAL